MLSEQAGEGEGRKAASRLCLELLSENMQEGNSVMAGKRYYETKEILNDTLELINKDRNEWRKFLTFVSKHYKFDFEDILLIYAQRPEATAVTDMYAWNNFLDRRIKRGTRSIAVFDESSETGLKYLFDVEDTYGAQLPRHWQLKERHEDDIKQLFLSNFKKEYTSNLNTSKLDNIIDMKIREDCAEYMEGLYDDAEGSYLEELDRHNVEIRFLSTVMDCVGNIVNERTGLNIGGNVNRELSFSAIWEFNTTELKMRLYNAIHLISKDILTTIEHSVKRQNKQKLINERSDENEHNIQRDERNTVSGHQSIREPQADNTAGQVRQNGAELPESSQTSQGTGNENQPNTERDIPTSGQGSGRDDDNSSEAIAGERPDTESQRIYGNTAAQEHDTGPGGGDSPERDSIPDEITGKEEKNEEGAETTAPSLVSRKEIYDEEEKGKHIAELAQKYEEQDIEQTLLRGSGFAGGKQRIVDFFAEEHPSKEKQDFLKNEYGTGGWSETFEGNRRGFSNHDSKGIEILNQGIYGPAVRLSWAKVSKRIEELIENSKYFEKRYELDKPPVRPQNSMQQLSLLVHEKEANDNEILKDYGYTWDGMELLDNHEAIELFNEGAEIYLLHEDNTESLVFENERELLLKHIADGGLVGIEKQKIPIEELIEEDEGAEEAPFLVQENNNTSEPIDYTITDNNLGIGGPKEKYKRNIEAIRLLKQIESEDRFATSEDQETLSQYVGWGGLPNAFDKSKSDWTSEYLELKELLNDDEYESARASTLNAHYTSPIVIKGIYEAINSFGFKNGNILEPAMGIGNFFGCMPEDMRADSHLTGVELDSISGRIAKQLYQSADIHVTGFERVNLPDNCFDVVIGNVPFGNYKVTDNKYDKYNFLIHDYFIAKSLDMVRPNGIIAIITSKGTMDKTSSSFREHVAKRAELVGAIRLPNNAFKQNAGTEVTSDILFFQKRDRMIDIKPEWVDIGQTGDNIPINKYYTDNPHMLLGRMVYQNRDVRRRDSMCPV